MISRTSAGPALVKSCMPILNIPTTSRSEATSSRAPAALSTSSATINLFFEIPGIEVWVISVSPNLVLMFPRWRTRYSASLQILTSATADSFVQRVQSFALHQLEKPAINVLSDARSLINKSRVELHQTGAGADFFPGVRS